MRAIDWGWTTLAIVVTTAAHAMDVPLPPPRPSGLAAEAVPLPPQRPAMLSPPTKPMLGPPMPQRQAFGQPMPPRETFGPPMPPRQTLGPPMPTVPANAPVAPPPPVEVPLDEELACERLFKSGKVVAHAIPMMPPTPEGCGIVAPIQMSAVIVSPDRRIGIDPPVTIDCALGEALADWVRDDLVPAFAAAAAPLAALEGTSGYQCRGRNRVVGAKLSEHGRGNAVDIGGLRTADGATIGVKQTGAGMLANVKATACARFATVLGPGSDGYHESHLHVDLEPRRHGSKICQWTLP